LVEKANKVGIKLSMTEASRWVSFVNELFPSMATVTRQLCDSTCKENKITTLAGTILPFEVPHQNQTTAIWNAVSQTSTNELVCFNNLDSNWFRFVNAWV
jgi:hypothetical protein